MTPSFTKNIKLSMMTFSITIENRTLRMLGYRS
jgi:hypothetical protein